MDTFIEQIVRKKKSVGEWLIIAAVLVAGVVLVLLGALMPQLLVFAIAAAAFGCWWVITQQNKEFEYCVTNGDIDVDLIIGKRSRKRLVSVTGRKVESLLPYDPTKSTAGYQRVVITAPSLREEGLWSFTYRSKKNGHTLVVFMPQQRVLEALYSGLPKQVQLDTDRAARERGITLSASRRSHGDE